MPTAFTIRPLAPDLTGSAGADSSASGSSSRSLPLFASAMASPSRHTRPRGREQVLCHVLQLVQVAEFRRNKGCAQRAAKGSDGILAVGSRSGRSRLDESPRRLLDALLDRHFDERWTRF